MSENMTAESILPLFCRYPPFLPGGEATDMVQLLRDSQQQAIIYMFSDTLNGGATHHQHTVNMFLYVVAHIEEQDLLTDFLYRVIRIHSSWNDRTKTVLQHTLDAGFLSEFAQKKVLAYWHRAYGECTLETLKNHYPDVNAVPLPLLWGMDQSHQFWDFLKQWDTDLYKRFWSRLSGNHISKQEY